MSTRALEWLRASVWRIRHALAERRARRASHRAEGSRLARAVFYGGWLR